MSEEEKGTTQLDASILEPVRPLKDLDEAIFALSGNTNPQFQQVLGWLRDYRDALKASAAMGRDASVELFDWVRDVATDLDETQRKIEEQRREGVAGERASTLALRQLHDELFNGTRDIETVEQLVERIIVELSTLREHRDADLAEVQQQLDDITENRNGLALANAQLGALLIDTDWFRRRFGGSSPQLDEPDLDERVSQLERDVERIGSQPWGLKTTREHQHERIEQRGDGPRERTSNLVLRRWASDHPDADDEVLRLVLDAADEQERQWRIADGIISDRERTIADVATALGLDIAVAPDELVRRARSSHENTKAARSFITSHRQSREMVRVLAILDGNVVAREVLGSVENAEQVAGPRLSRQGVTPAEREIEEHDAALLQPKRNPSVERINEIADDVADLVLGPEGGDDAPVLASERHGGDSPQRCDECGCVHEPGENTLCPR